MSYANDHGPWIDDGPWECANCGAELEDGEYETCPHCLYDPAGGLIHEEDGSTLGAPPLCVPRRTPDPESST